MRFIFRNRVLCILADRVAPQRELAVQVGPRRFQVFVSARSVNLLSTAGGMDYARKRVSRRQFWGVMLRIEPGRAHVHVELRTYRAHVCPAV